MVFLDFNGHKDNGFIAQGVGTNYIVVTQYLNPVFALNKDLNGIFLISKSVF